MTLVIFRKASLWVATTDEPIWVTLVIFR